MSSESIVPTYILQSDGLFREGLRLLLSKTRFRPQGCAIDLEDLSDVPCDRPALFIVAVGPDQALICGKIKSQYPLAFIVAVADESNPRSLAAALEDGANAALFNSVSSEDLVSTLQAVTNGKLILIDARLWPIDLQPKPVERLPLLADGDPPEVAEPRGLKLSTREIAILERIVHGESNKHVARFFKIAEPTVKAHVKAIFRKIGANNRTQAAIWAMNHRLFDQDLDASGDLPVLLSDDLGH
jgi:two-component system, NarL family, nitrate/nitrite response regulator NarL